MSSQKDLGIRRKVTEALEALLEQKPRGWEGQIQRAMKALAVSQAMAPGSADALQVVAAVNHAAAMVSHAIDLWERFGEDLLGDPKDPVRMAVNIAIQDLEAMGYSSLARDLTTKRAAFTAQVAERLAAWRGPEGRKRRIRGWDEGISALLKQVSRPASKRQFRRARLKQSAR